MKRTINYGKHAAYSNRRINEVTLTLSINPSKFYNPKTKEHYTKGEYFSVCGDVWNATHTDIIQGGQCVDYIVKNFAKDKNSKNIRALWEVFHLQLIEKIPERFRNEITNYVKCETNIIDFERKNCAAYILKVNEKITDYGTYTDGEITVKTPDGISETILLEQGDEIKNPITNRAYKALSFLYKNIPSVEDLARTAKVTTNSNEYTKNKQQEKTKKIEEIKNIAERIIDIINSGNYGKEWSTALHEIKYAEKFLFKKQGE